jgi:hypothetical protein
MSQSPMVDDPYCDSCELMTPFIGQCCFMLTHASFLWPLLVAPFFVAAACCPFLVTAAGCPLFWPLLVDGSSWCLMLVDNLFLCDDLFLDASRWPHLLWFMLVDRPLQRLMLVDHPLL